jgi:type II secretory pathway component PulF
MATYVVTLKRGLAAAGKNSTSNRVVKVAAPDGKTAMQIAESGGWSSIRAVPELETKTKRVEPFPRKPLIVLCNSVAAMLDAQIPLPRALEFYTARVVKEDLRLTLKSIAVAVDRGDDNHKAFQATGRFDPTFVGLVRAGTMASNLSAALRALSRRMKTNAEFSSKLRKALLTPCAIMVFLWFVLIYSMTMLMPTVEKMLKDMRVEPDAFSGAIFWFSHFFQVIYMPVTIAMVVLLLLTWRSRAFRTTLFKFLMDRWKILREIVMGFRQLTFIGTFEMLIANNIPMSDALDTCSRTLKNTAHEKELQEVKSRLALGMNLGEAVRKYTTFDSQLSHMLEVGEKASNMAEQLRLLRDLYEEETAQRIEMFTEFVGVASKIVTVTIIAGIYLGTYMPIVMAGPKIMNSGL